ncbi:MAG: sulfatase-like hydrolase/transferase [candidate division KSB1 bacterium]|nr:sulfatase-like hydrolase/transferase [candidate division KSB1 bacterium]
MVAHLIRPRNWNKLAGTGIQFMHCYSQPLCTPSRVQIMTGQYNFRNYTGWGTLDLHQRTFGDVMKKGGYATCLSGKWQLKGDLNAPQKAGFDEYCFWNIGSGFAAIKGSRYANPTIYQNGKKLKNLENKYGPDVFCEFATRFITKHRNDPFFVYYPMVLPHRPFRPTPDSLINSENTGASERSSNQNFADMVAYVDKIVGCIVDKLDTLGIRENTLILFTTDNGTHEQIVSKLGKVSIRGGKGQTTDAGTRVPLIANWKGHTPEGMISNDLVDFTDFLPTVAELGDIPLSTVIPIDGVSFFPQLLGKQENPREWVFCSFNPKKSGYSNKEIRFARDQRWKLYDSGQLFDIKNDPLESHPVSKNNQTPKATSARQKLQKALASYQHVEY